MKNDYYYYLNLPFEFKKQLPDFSKSPHVIMKRGDFPLFERWLNSLKLTIRHADVFKKEPGWPFNYNGTIHIDGNDFDNHVKINFVFNSRNSKIVWYKLKEGASVVNFPSRAYSPAKASKPEDCYQVEEALTNRPMILNTGCLHDVRDVEQTRYCFSFQLAPLGNLVSKVYWHEVETYFKDYIEYPTK
jgi:hypothetical protein